MKKSQRKWIRSVWNHLLRLKYIEKDEDEWFWVEKWPKTSLVMKKWMGSENLEKEN